MKLLHGVRRYDSYLMMKNHPSILFFSSIQKCTTAVRMLACGSPSDTHDVSHRMMES
jgi:hypothetical protein